MPAIYSCCWQWSRLRGTDMLKRWPRRARPNQSAETVRTALLFQLSVEWSKISPLLVDCWFDYVIRIVFVYLPYVVGPQPTLLPCGRDSQLGHHGRLCVHYQCMTQFLLWGIINLLANTERLYLMHCDIGSNYLIIQRHNVNTGWVSHDVSFYHNTFWQ